jgi:Zn-dependent protease
MPFKCNYCGGYFCEQHRLPEFHDCPGTYNASKIGNTQFGSYTQSSGYGSNYSTSKVTRPFWFSNREIRDLAVGLAVILMVPLFNVWNYFLQEPLFIGLYLVILTLAFMLHEIAHKFMAQRMGLWAEFRISLMGIVLTVFSFLLLQTRVLPIMFIAPGAVMIAGMINSNEWGKIGLAGPVTNIVQALIYLILLLLAPNDVIGELAYIGVAANSGLAIFNLIPFGVFDGEKIFKWNWKAWLGAVIVAGSLFIYATL